MSLSLPTLGLVFLSHSKDDPGNKKHWNSFYKLKRHGDKGVNGVELLTPLLFYSIVFSSKGLLTNTTHSGPTEFFGRRDDKT